MKNQEKVKQGKRNRANGAAFERRVRKDLEDNGWIVSKWQNNVELNYHESSPKLKVIGGIIIPAKASRYRLSSTGFPDFMALKKLKKIQYNEKTIIEDNETYSIPLYEIIFIECKINGKLSKEEKEKAKWYLDNNVCSKFFVAEKTKVKNKVVIKYNEIE